MKRILLFLPALFTCMAVFCQYDTTPPYLKTRILPAFSLLTIDSIEFNQSVLEKDKYIIIMLFNPECEHCQKQLELLLSIPKVTRSAQLILSSIETNGKNRLFYNKNHLERFSFVHLGKDHKYFFGGYFKPQTIPVLVFYDKKGNFTLISQGNTSKRMILDALKD